MTREDALALLDAMRRDPNPPPPIEPEKMAALFVAVTSDDPDLRFPPPGSGGKKVIDGVLSSVVAMAALAFVAAIVVGAV